MWHITAPFEKSQIEGLPKAGFTVNSTGGVVRVERYGCGAEFRRTPAGLLEMTEAPSVMVGGEFKRLWDAGYQKFLLRPDGKKSPALAPQLASLRRFTEELQTALNVPTYYNEALGSTCVVSTYDRVKGRPGDVPDQSVGASAPEKH